MRLFASLAAAAALVSGQVAQAQADPDNPSCPPNPNCSNYSEMRFSVEDVDGLYSELLATKPEEVVRRAVKGMLPKGPLGRKMLKKLKVYAGSAHPHTAQKPTELKVEG